MPEFEKFLAHAVVGDGPTVTIRKSGGSLLMNRPAYELLREPTHVELYYSRQERVIGIKGVDATSPDGLQLKAGRNQKSYVIPGRAFFKHFGLTWDAAHRFGAQLDGDILCVDLGDAGSENSQLG